MKLILKNNLSDIFINSSNNIMHYLFLKTTFKDGKICRNTSICIFYPIQQMMDVTIEGVSLLLVVDKIENIEIQHLLVANIFLEDKLSWKSLSKTLIKLSIPSD